MTKSNLNYYLKQNDFQCKMTSNIKREISQETWSDLVKIINLSFCDQTKLLKNLKQRRLPIEEDHKY